MLDNIKNYLYMKKVEVLFKQGIKDGRIVSYEDEFYEKLSHTYISGLPVSIHIKYLRPQGKRPGKCYDRSLMMFLSIDESILVTADLKNFEISNGKDGAFHYWIELGDYVYDPTYLQRFDKDLYYKMFEPTNIEKCNKEEYCLLGENKKFYEDIKSTTIDDYKPSGKRRLELAAVVPLVSGIAELSGDEQFVSDLNKYLEEVNYNEEQINNEIDLALQKIVKQKITKEKKAQN